MSANVTFRITSCVVLSCMDTFHVFVTFFLFWKFVLPSPQLFLRLVSLAYASFSLESKRSKRFGIIIFFCNSVMNLAAWDHSSTLVFGSLFTTASGVKIEVPKLTVIFMPSIISGLFSFSTYSCSLECSTSSLSTSMFLLLNPIWSRTL